MTKALEQLRVFKGIFAGYLFLLLVTFRGHFKAFLKIRFFLPILSRGEK